MNESRTQCRLFDRTKTPIKPAKQTVLAVLDKAFNAYEPLEHTGRGKLEAMKATIHKCTLSEPFGKGQHQQEELEQVCCYVQARS